MSHDRIKEKTDPGREAEVDAAVAATTRMVLSHFLNRELAALNNAVTGFGSVAEANHGYQRAFDTLLIRKDGKPHDKDVLEAAMSMEINARVAARTWK